MQAAALGWEAGLASKPSRTGQQEVPGPRGGREEFVERMDLLCGLRRGPLGDAQTDGQRDCTA